MYALALRTNEDGMQPDAPRGETQLKYRDSTQHSEAAELRQAIIEHSLELGPHIEVVEALMIYVRLVLVPQP
jgi:hypothetical protein